MSSSLVIVTSEWVLQRIEEAREKIPEFESRQKSKLHMDEMPKLLKRRMFGLAAPYLSEPVKTAEEFFIWWTSKHGNPLFILKIERVKTFLNEMTRFASAGKICLLTQEKVDSLSNPFRQFPYY